MKLSAQIANKIVEQVAAADWPVGRILATENELTRQHGVSRAAIREAVGLLALRGVAVMKPGKGGGLLVSASAFDATVTALAIYLELADVRIEDTLEVWQLLEAKAVELTILNIDNSAAQELASFAERLAEPVGDVAHETAIFREFWNLLGRLSRNPLLRLLIAGFQIALSGLTMSRAYKPHEMARHLEESKAIKRDLIRHLLSCDLFMAQSALRENFRAQRRSVERSEALTMRGINEDRTRSDMKLPRWIALQISRRIADHQLQPNDPLGSEAELLAQYQVSRSVLREAIRMLEAYSVVEMRRGQSGGLRVSTPDPQPTLDSVVGFLRTIPLSAADTHHVRAALEVRAAGRAARHATDPHIAAIGQAIEAARGGEDHQERVASLSAISSAIARASENPVMAFILAISLQINGDSEVTVSKEAVDHSVDAYATIYDAIRPRDSVLARRLMHQHLRAVASGTAI